MNSYLLQFVGKWISFLVVSMTSLFGTYNLKSVEIINTNDNSNKSMNVTHKIVEYETIVNRTSKLPLNTKRIVKKGKNGLVYENNETKTVEVIKKAVNEVIELGTGPAGQFHGRLTAYGADCKGCSGTVAYRTKENKSHNLLRDGVIYNDEDYGEIRILAAPNDVFQRGTIIEITRESDEPFIGVVLDTGSALNSAWRNDQRIIIDLAFETEKDPEVYKTTSNNVKYKVLRWGW